MATTVTSRTAAWATSASAPSTITITIATAAAGTSVSRTFWTRRNRLYRRNDSIHTVEVRLIIRIEIRAAFDYRRGRRALWNAVRRRRWCQARYLISLWRRRSPAHFGALLFQNRLP